jgi:flagellar protein FlaF
MRKLYLTADGCEQSRSRSAERRALEQLVATLDAAEQAGPQSRQAIEALTIFNAVWSDLLEDLASPENDLPRELRAQLISIGLFLLKEAEAIRTSRSGKFSALREITATIASGLA